MSILLVAMLMTGSAWAEPVQPVVDAPLRDPAICRGTDGVYYLNGTVAGNERRGTSRPTLSERGPKRPTTAGSASERLDLPGRFGEQRSSESLDFANNDGIYLWKSTDLLAWQPVSKVWDLAKDAKSRWTRMKGVKLDNPTGDTIHLSPTILYYLVEK